MAANRTHRPAFHLTPERGRLNDPNGLVRLGGTWHVFYQLDPGFPRAPRRTGWGYATSEDLLTWRHRPQALHPDDDYDADGCYSGGAVPPQEPGGPVELFYTGNLPAPEEYGGCGATGEAGEAGDAAGDVRAPLAADRLREEFPDGIPVGHVWGATQNLATADVLPDGSLAEPVKHPGNPLIPGPPPGITAHYRDPIVTEDPDHPGVWRMILGARTDDDRGTAIVHFSRDRRTWDAGRELLIDGPSPGGYMWECPNLLRMTDASTGEDADVLILSPQGIRADSGDPLRNRYQCGYVVGHVEAPESPADPLVFRVTTPFTEFDHGFEFYAPQIFAAGDDGDSGNSAASSSPSGPGAAESSGKSAASSSPSGPVMLGWMGMPEEDDHPSVVAEGWVHCLTFARELALHDGRLLQSPILPPAEELPEVGDGHIGGVFRVRLEGDGIVELYDADRLADSPDTSESAVHGLAENDNRAADSRGTSNSTPHGTVEGTTCDNTGETPLVTVSLTGDRVTVTRSDAAAPNHFGDQRATTLRPTEAANGADVAGGHRLDVVVDRSAIEIIADDGAGVFSLRAFTGGGGGWAVRRRSCHSVDTPE